MFLRGPKITCYKLRDCNLGFCLKRGEQKSIKTKIQGGLIRIGPGRDDCDKHKLCCIVGESLWAKSKYKAAYTHGKAIIRAAHK